MAKNQITEKVVSKYPYSNYEPGYFAPVPVLVACFTCGKVHEADQSFTKWGNHFCDMACLDLYNEKNS